MERRAERLASIIRRELAEIILHELHDPRIMGMPSITRVKLVDDMSTADVFVTIMGTPGQQTAALNALKHSAGMMRTRLTKAIAIRQVPFIRFQIDEQLKEELKVLELIDKVARENAEIDRKRAEAAGQIEPASQEEQTPQETGDRSPRGPLHAENAGLGETAPPTQADAPADEPKQE